MQARRLLSVVALLFASGVFGGSIDTRTPCVAVADHFQPEHFGNRALTRLLEQSRTAGTAGVIYVWSPHMPLSMIGLREVAAVTREMGIMLVAVVDPHADPGPIDEALRRCEVAPEHTARLTSAALVRRGLLNHFPGMVVFASGALVGESWLGYHAPPAVQSHLADRIK